MDVDKLLELVMKESENRRLGAGYAGRYDDGGASRLADQVKFYKYGRDGVVPPEWEEYKKKLDPEWEEFQRLKNKFEG